MTQGTIRKADAVKRIVEGEVLIPDLEDSQGDVMTAVDIEKAAHGFLAKYGDKGATVGYVGKQHDEVAEGCVVVESFIARDGDPVYKTGTWVMAVKCSETMWDAVENGEFTGFSVGGTGTREDMDDE